MEEIFSYILDTLSDSFGALGRGIERSLTSLFGSSNARYLKKLQPQVAAINALEPKYQAMSDAEGADREVPQTSGGRRNARRTARRGLRGLP